MSAAKNKRRRVLLEHDETGELLSAREARSARRARQKAAQKERRRSRATRADQATGRGYRGAGNGEAFLMDSPAEWRGSSMQVCGLWPWIGGSATPFFGAPLGIDLDTAAPVGADPIAWFKAGIINNPSIFLLGLPGYGKSSFVRHMMLGMNGRGVIPLVPGDLKPDYVDEIRAMGGQVITLAPGRGHINVMDPGEISAIAHTLPEKIRNELMIDAHSRKLQMISALITILRKGPVSEHEESILDQAITLVEEDFMEADRAPLVGDLLEKIRSRPQSLSDVALDHGDEKRYREATDGLVASLMSLNGSGRFGDMFSRQTSASLKMDRPAVYDVSMISDTQRDVQAAALMACWTTTFASVGLAHALADEGLAPRREFFVAMDEIWRALRSGPSMVERVDAMTRLNRNDGYGMAMITHTMSDLDALPTEEDRAKARGFVERSGMVVTGALPRAEMAKLRQAVPLSNVEADRLISWADPGSWSRIRRSRANGTRPRQAPGVGKFMVKVGGRPGIALNVRLTPSELSMNDTNKRWGNQDGRVVVESPNEVTNAMIQSESALPEAS